METNLYTGVKPSIIVRQTDHSRLTSLALAAPGRDLDVADELLAELERASVVIDASFPPEAVGLGSTVSYETERGQARTVTLCYPGRADIERSMVSVMTPVGVALLGLSSGQSINWSGRDGHVHRLTVTSVKNIKPSR
ncbi:nucleoside diphosphate kinase regulator [Rhizobium ruizarguesonis]|uniref:Nucleoside diphosphate kinase regulator n=1 Tax=Rhizobium ruizarguesonis TaxID=2081791 RepID=A0ABY1WW29_9HYPH|nr:nucleoside diphosphate kinase regulator [Rhizobium ruizarguesonis]TAU13083.1 nucleoside diphosphate kinase regulator [Rhizobium ruizarguesonis]TAU57638.1 nucleoside diphosphate kinase regulator [Rhizobium ruizarguesonis]TAV19095.1 nucleoside diphosphate kinase regulator [Rhizobium ruizarguesonis]TAW01948.1 nucleoside diphosphate kinase regulator [Rhizobium ruizarguesonis]TAW47995.1 nucleoside diphosphate kinase regulator [Rhizobium ruizarguesonis]